MTDARPVETPDDSLDSNEPVAEEPPTPDELEALNVLPRARDIIAKARAMLQVTP